LNTKAAAVFRRSEPHRPALGRSQARARLAAVENGGGAEPRSFENF